MTYHNIGNQEQSSAADGAAAITKNEAINVKDRYFPVHLYLKNVRRKQHNRGPYEGKIFIVPRGKEKGVRVRLYRPVSDSGRTLPVLFNVHGGGWIFGDAEGVDLQSQYLANHLDCFVVNIDYLMADEKPFPYQQTEIADTVEYFISHCRTYHIDPDRIALMGYSAGGHLCAGAAILLRERGVRLCTQVLCYPFLNFIGFDYAKYGGYSEKIAPAFNRAIDRIFFENEPKDSLLVSPGNAEAYELRGLAPAVIITCGAGDPLLPQGEEYAWKLTGAGVKNVYKEYEKAVHGFMEHNFPDDPAVFEHEDEQDRLMREAVEFVRDQDIFAIPEEA
ncbi:MAG: alpha/beta hydrolase [Clostridia bacterium]|nr:alpha/beta hydrolase [Clostridia bacterium]